MDNQQEPQDKGRKLNDQEIKEVRNGQLLYETTHTPGWEIIKKIFETMAFHSWSDPRETNSEKEWLWRELNSFHAANTAREVIENIEQQISRGDYLDKVQKGEVETQRMKI
jgi:hypothetical protein